MARHRYRQAPIGGLPGAKGRDYSPKGQELAGPSQGWLALDGGALGPLFNNHEPPPPPPPMGTTSRTWPRDYAGFEALPFIHSILKGAVDGVDGVGILTRSEWLPDGTDGSDVWGQTWIQARAQWLREIAPMLLPKPQGGGQADA